MGAMEPEARALELENEALAEFEESLVVPEQPTRRTFVLCPVGLIGSGKSTVIKPLTQMLSLVRISGDEFRELLKKRGLGYESIPRLLPALTKKYVSNGYSVAIDSDCASPRNTKAIVEMEHEYGALAIWIHINPPEAFILDKLRHRRPGLFKDAAEAIANYERRKPLHEHLAMPFMYEIDTSKPDAAARINKMATGIAERVSVS